MRAACLLLALLGAAPTAWAQAAAPELPARMAWVWDRPQPALPWPADVGVAYQQTTVRLSGHTAQLRRRQWPLSLPSQTVALPVVHVSLDGLRPPALDAPQQALVRHALLNAWARSATGWVQLDLEARPSQRAGYTALLRSLQAQRTQPHPVTGQRLRVSVTALASWCLHDPWLPAELVDEIVPMYFHMGREAEHINADLARQGQARVPACRQASGWLSGAPHWVSSARHYHFNPQPWRATDWPALVAPHIRTPP